MLVVVAKFTILKHNLPQFLHLANKLVELSKLEKGCVSYKLIQNNVDLNNILFVEEWKSQIYLDDHNQTSHFKTIVPQLISLTSEDVIIEKYQVLL